MLAIVYEHNHNFRIIHMDMSQVTGDEYDVDETFMGYSVGRWEGNTLIIDSVRIKTKTVLDESGLPHSEKLNVTENLRKLDDSTLEVVATIEDPEFYVRPWSLRWVFRRDPQIQMQEYICGTDVFEHRYRSGS